MKRAPHKGCDELYTADEIRLVYQKCGIPSGAVKTEDLSFFYTNFLAEQDVDLVVYSDKSGPKSYSYITNLNKETVHIKGFSLNNDNVKEKLNFLSLCSCIENKNQVINIKYVDKISKDKLNHIFKADEEKNFSFTFNKRC